MAPPRHASVAPPPGRPVRPSSPRSGSRGRGSAAGREQLAEEPLGLAQSLLGEHDRLGLADRVGDEALLVEPVHRIPVKPLPSPAAVVQAEVEQGEDRLVDPVGVDLHSAAAPRGRQFDTLRRDYTTPDMSTNAATALTGCVRRFRGSMMWRAIDQTGIVLDV